MNLSASTLTGTPVKNGQGDSLGKIEDLMIDTTTGVVSYAVLSFGGFLGMGDKLFAVPMQGMQIDAEDQHFLLNESKERLKDAPGFDKDNWPDFADPKWQQTIFSFYAV